MIEKKLLELLVCPVEKGDLNYDRENEKLVCRICGRKYPVVDDIPIMLIEEAELPEENRKEG